MDLDKSALLEFVQHTAHGLSRCPNQVGELELRKAMFDVHRVAFYGPEPLGEVEQLRGHSRGDIGVVCRPTCGWPSSPAGRAP